MQLKNNPLDVFLDIVFWDESYRTNSIRVTVSNALATMERDSPEMAAISLLRSTVMNGFLSLANTMSSFESRLKYLSLISFYVQEVDRPLDDLKRSFQDYLNINATQSRSVFKNTFKSMCSDRQSPRMIIQAIHRIVVRNCEQPQPNTSQIERSTNAFFEEIETSHIHSFSVATPGYEVWRSKKEKFRLKMIQLQPEDALSKIKEKTIRIRKKLSAQVFKSMNDLMVVIGNDLELPMNRFDSEELCILSSLGVAKGWRREEIMALLDRVGSQVFQLQLIGGFCAQLLHRKDKVVLDSEMSYLDEMGTAIYVFTSTWTTKELESSWPDRIKDAILSSITTPAEGITYSHHGLISYTASLAANKLGPKNMMHQLLVSKTFKTSSSQGIRSLPGKIREIPYTMVRTTKANDYFAENVDMLKEVVKGQVKNFNSTSILEKVNQATNGLLLEYFATFVIIHDSSYFGTNIDHAETGIVYAEDYVGLPPHQEIYIFDDHFNLLRNNELLRLFMFI
uniref:Uncharacterized protein n=1 Tax=Ditylenchus dipsaci TaxID=166011 RepID=A0A915CVZ0_9BILA